MRLERRKKHRSAEVPTHALNDIMFFLLLFFLIISTMASKLNSVKITLPSNKTDRQGEKGIELSINENKEYFIDDRSIKLEDLPAALNKELETKKPEDRVVALRIDKNLTVQDFVDVLEIGAKNKIRMYLRTEKLAQ
ncbi:MAG: ExbD/TolR family protein [Flavobacteriales bacterium]